MAIDSFKPFTSPPPQLATDQVGVGPRLHVPPGAYLIGDLHIDKAMVLTGPVGSLYAAAWLAVKPNCNGIIVDALGTRRAQSSGSSGRSSVIEHLNIIGNLSIANAPPGRPLDGIVIHADQVVLRNLTVTGFGNNGVSILSGVGSPASNADGFLIQQCRLSQNGLSQPTEPTKGNGLYTDGPNAQIGTCIGTFFTDNFWYGVYDRSQIGNTYIGGEMTANGHNWNVPLAGLPGAGGAVRAEGAFNASLFLGVYSESQVGEVSTSGAMAVGGFLAGMPGFSGWDRRNADPALWGQPVAGISASKTHLHFLHENRAGNKIEAEIPQSQTSAGESGMNAMLFYYRQSADAGDSAHGVWAIRRYKLGSDTLSELPTATAALGPSPYGSPLRQPSEPPFNDVAAFDRCWGIGWMGSLGDQTYQAMGWTDMTHPQGPAHPYFPKPFMNQRAKMSLRTAVLTLPPGKSSLKVFDHAWLVAEEVLQPCPTSVDPRGWTTQQALLSASFAIEVPAQESLAQTDVRVGEYQLVGQQLSVNFYNSSVDSNHNPVSCNVILVAHFERYFPWDPRLFAGVAY